VLWKVVSLQITWKGRNETTTQQEREVKTKIKIAQNKYKKYYNLKRRPHSIRKGDWVRVTKKIFLLDTLTMIGNSKYSAPAKVLKVKNGSITLEANRDFGKDTRVNVSRLKMVWFHNKDERETLEDN
jgi:hypothetical protein